jgi:cell division septation protein DedD
MAGSCPTPDANENMKSRINRHASSYDSTQKLILLSAGLVSAAEIVILIWSANMIDLGGGAWIDRLQNRVTVQVKKLVKPQTIHTTAERKAGDRGDEIQTDAVSGLEIPSPPAAGKTNLTTLTDTDTNNSGTATSSDLNTKSMQPTVDVKIKSQQTNRGSGTWAINLVSFQRKVDAERFVIKANHKGIAAEINQVTVSGKKYWRVQVPGFTSLDEARKKASEVQNRLALKDVWIVQR